MGRSVIFIFESYTVKLNKLSVILKKLEIKCIFDTYGSHINININNINIRSLPKRILLLIEHDQIAAATTRPCRNRLYEYKLFIAVSNTSHAVTRSPRRIKLFFQHCISCTVTGLRSETILGILNYSHHY